jgi:hypothetical protein
MGVAPNWPLPLTAGRCGFRPIRAIIGHSPKRLNSSFPIGLSRFYQFLSGRSGPLCGLSDTSDQTFTVLASAWGIEKLRNRRRTVNLGQLSDWIRFGPTIVSNQLVKGPGAKGAVRIWAIKGGGVNPRTGFRLPFHYHIHRYNWYKPWTWFKQTPILK